MVHRFYGIEVFLLNLMDSFGKMLVYVIHYGGIKPFQKGWIASSKKSQSLSEFPANQINIIVIHMLYDIALFFHLKIPFWFVNINEAYIPITIGGLKAPCTATRLNREKFITSCSCSI